MSKKTWKQGMLRIPIHSTISNVYTPELATRTRPLSLLAPQEKSGGSVSSSHSSSLPSSPSFSRLLSLTTRRSRQVARPFRMLHVLPPFLCLGMTTFFFLLSSHRTTCCLCLLVANGGMPLLWTGLTRRKLLTRSPFATEPVYSRYYSRSFSSSL